MMALVAAAPRPATGHLAHLKTIPEAMAARSLAARRSSATAQTSPRSWSLGCYSAGPISKRMRAAKPPARGRSRSRPSRSRSCGGSMRCSRSSAPSMAGAPERLEMRQTLSRPLVEDLQVYMREQLAKLSPWGRPGQGVQLHPEAVGELHAVPGGRPSLSLEQCRRKRLARHRPWTKILVVLRL